MPARGGGWGCHDKRRGDVGAWGGGPTPPHPKTPTPLRFSYVIHVPVIGQHVDLARPVHTERHHAPEIAHVPQRARGDAPVVIREAAQPAAAVVRVEVLADQRGGRAAPVREAADDRAAVVVPVLERRQYRSE